MSQFKLRKAVFTKELGAGNLERIDYSKVKPAKKKDTELSCSKSGRNLLIEVNQKSSYGSLPLDGERMQKFMKNIVRVKEAKNYDNLKSLSLVMKRWTISEEDINLLETLAKYLRYNFKALQILRLDFQGKKCIDDEVVNSISKYIIPVLPDLRQLQSMSLDFQNCENLTDNSIMGLSEAIYPNRSLREFCVRFESWKCYRDYKYSKITNKSITSFYNQIIENFHALENLHFENRYLKITKQRDTDIWNTFDLSLEDYFLSDKSVSGYSHEDPNLDDLFIGLLIPILPNLRTTQNLNINFGYNSDEVSEKALIKVFKQMGKNLKALQNLHLDSNICRSMPEKPLRELASQIGSNFKSLKHLHLKLEDFYNVTDATVAEYVNQISSNLENLEDLFLSFKGHPKITENSVSPLFKNIRTLLTRLKTIHIIMPSTINTVEEQFEFLTDDGIRSIQTLILDFDNYFKIELTNEPNPSVDENTAQNSLIGPDLSLGIQQKIIFLPNIFNHLKPHLEVLRSLQLGFENAKYKYSEITHIFRQIVPDLKILEHLNIIFPCYRYWSKKDADADADLNQEIIALADILEPVFKTLQTLSLSIMEPLNGEAVLYLYKMVMTHFQSLKDIDLYFKGWASLNNTSEPKSELCRVAHPELPHWEFSLNTEQENLMLLLNEMLPTLESFQSISCDIATFALLCTIQFNPKSLFRLGLNTGRNPENTTVSVFKYIATKFSTVESLSVKFEDQFGMTDEPIIALAKIIESDLLNLQYLNLSTFACHNLSDHSLIAISSVLPLLRGISLNFSHCQNITDEGIFTLLLGDHVGGIVKRFEDSKDTFKKYTKMTNQFFTDLSHTITQGVQDYSTLSISCNSHTTLSEDLNLMAQNYQSTLETYQKTKLALDNCQGRRSELNKRVENELNEHIKILTQSRLNKLQYLDLNFDQCFYQPTDKSVLTLCEVLPQMQKLEHLSLSFKSNKPITEAAKEKLRNCVQSHLSQLEHCSLIFDDPPEVEESDDDKSNKKRSGSMNQEEEASNDESHSDSDN